MLLAMLLVRLAWRLIHVIKYVDVNAVCIGVEIYSSQTTTWIYKESEWDEHTDVTFYRQPSLFLNGCLHIMGHPREYPTMLVVWIG